MRGVSRAPLYGPCALWGNWFGMGAGRRSGHCEGAGYCALPLVGRWPRPGSRQVRCARPVVTGLAEHLRAIMAIAGR